MSEGFTDLGDCSECGQPMDERDAFHCDACGRWVCRTCWPHDGSFVCGACGESAEGDE